MRLTFLGHAGFLLETSTAVVVMDPWLSPHGAFDSSWFQLPQNHHMGAWVRAKLSDPSKERFVYVSHEHRDHFDPVFLASLPTDQITAIVPFFKRAAFRSEMADLAWKRLVLCKDDVEVPFPDGSIRLYVSDSTLNRDSAILVKSSTASFLDLNDCKIHDRLGAISKEGPITAFSAQFSGAIWHPVRYDYDERTYNIVSKKKMFSKFEAVARAIQSLSPGYFFAAAGPACFLDPDLLHENFRKVGIFPRAPEFFRFLEKRLGNIATRFVEPMPGDTLDLQTGEWIAKAEERLSDEGFEAYVRGYAQRMAPVLAARQRNISQAECGTVVDRLEAVLQEKLDRLSLRERIHMPLFVQVEEVPDSILRVDFPAGKIERVGGMPEEGRHALRAKAVDLLPLLDRTITWDEFLLSLRFTMSRKPDVYDAVLHGFLAIEPEDLPGFCDHILAAESRQERMLVQIGDRRYSVHRYCPHQGADLSQAWIEKGRYLVCPRHRWQFDLENEGKCTFNDCSIRAIEEPRVEGEAEPPVEITLHA